jgi:putative ABC transport system permease protein
MAPGAIMPDDHRFGIVWMGRDALAAAYDLDGAFNNISLALQRDASRAEVISKLDLLLDRYGGAGAIARKDHISNWFLMNELDQMEKMARIIPTIFLAVAAFLANMVLGRLIAVERGEIGLMKAFGYTNGEVAWHYAKLVIAMACAGVLLGWVLGAGLAGYNTRVYADLFNFPLLYFRPDPASFVIAGGVSMAAALAGSLNAVFGAARLPPAEAMRPPEPPSYHRDRLGRSRFAKIFDQPTRIFLRQILRWPLRSALTSIAIGFSVSVMVMALQWIDFIDHIVTVNFYESQRQDTTLGLQEPGAPALLYDAAHLPGVLAVEPQRHVPADFMAGVKRHRGSLSGLPQNPKLQLVFDVEGRSLELPLRGVVVSTKLAEKLGVSAGDTLRIKFLTGKRREVTVPIIELFETYIGMPAYMEIGSLNRLLLEPPTVDLINLRVDQAALPSLFSELKELPSVSAVTLRQAAIDTFHETMGETMMIFVTFFTGFACALGYGVVYNSTRIALSERGRELATLRVLGFSRWEISYILLGEVLLLIFIGLPLGCLTGLGLAWLISETFETELFRVPLVIEASTYGYSVLVALVATLFSCAFVRRRLDRLDLIAVLKTRE